MHPYGVPFWFASIMLACSPGGDTPVSRRHLLESLTTVATATTAGLIVHDKTSAAFASNVRAPIECLLPAIRVKLYIDEAVRVAENASGGNLQSLQDLLFVQAPTSFIQGEGEMAASQNYLAIQTQNSWNEKRRLEREDRGAQMGIDYTTPYDKANTAIQGWGDKRQFQILRRRQRQLEQSDPMRAALNSYTNNLIYSDSYQLNAQGQERKQLIRDDALPNVNAVVVSDLDLRDLVRNQVLENVQEAKFEVEFQLKQSKPEVQEVLVYLKQAQKSCDEWFSYIPTADVEEALNIVKSNAT